MRAAHARAGVGRGLLQLAQQVSVVLAGETRPRAQQVALPERAVALLALAEVDAGAFRQVPAVTDTLRGRREAAQARHVGGHVREVLGAGQVMPVGEVLHALVPALLVAEIGELLEQHAAVLPGDRGDLPVLGAAAVRSVAGGAGLVQLRAMREIGLEPGALGELAVARDARSRIRRGRRLRRRGSGDGKQCQHHRDTQRTHAITVTAGDGRRIKRTTYGVTHGCESLHQPWRRTLTAPTLLVRSKSMKE